MPARRSRCHYAVLLVAAAAATGCSDGASSAMSRCSTVNTEAHFGTTKRVGKALTTFYVNSGSEPEYLDPSLASDSASDTLVDDLFEGLFVPHPETQRPMQGMAVAWAKSDDNRVYRFELRPEARWSDGQPVVAEDFVYAWQRVATAATGARMAAFMYVLKNGKLYHQGRLRVTRRAERLRPSPGQDSGPPLAVGTALRILTTSPARAEIPLESQAPAAGTAFTYRKKTGSGAASLTPWSGTGPAPEGLVTIVGIGAEVSCNEAPDRLYQVETAGRKGYLPGCALKGSSKDAKWAVVAAHDGLPTFRPTARSPAPAPDPPPPSRPGVVPYDALALDPSVLGVRAVGDHVLEVELEQPTPYFLELCTTVTLFPVRRDVIERFEKMGRPDLWYRPENIVTNGPYTLDEWKFRYEITFKRNPHYYDHDKLKIHRIVWLQVGDYHASLNLYRTGELDYIGANLSLPQTLMRTLASHRDFYQADYLATYWYELNVQKPPVDDVRVRRALNLGLDKQLLVDTVTRGGQRPARHYVPDQTGSGYDQQVEADQRAGKDRFNAPGFVFDPERGRALLAEAGYPVVRQDDGWHATGFPALEILYNTSQGHRDIALAVQAMWREHLGVTAQLRNEEWKVMIKNVRDGHFQVARYGWVADYSHPHSWMETFLSDSANNPSRWVDPAFDALLRRAAATGDEEASIQLYRQAEAMALTAMPKLPVYFYTKSTLVKPYVKGFYEAPTNNHPIRWMWLDPNWCDGDSPNRPAYVPQELPKPGRITP